MAKKKSGGRGSGGKRKGGNPPKEHQYPPGVSGNYDGRPPGSRNLSTVVMEAARKNITATIDGKQRRISMLQATVMQLAKKAAGGDQRAMSEFLDRVDEMERRAEEGKPGKFALGPPDVEVLHAIHERMQQFKNPGQE